MRTETKVVQVANSPSEINAINASQALWGWSVMSVQITDRKTVYDGDTTGYVDELGVHTTTQRITETANYATITYTRDLDAPNAKELSRLETEYEKQTGIAKLYGIEHLDETYISKWPEENEWYQRYKKKEKMKGTAYTAAFGIGIATAVIVNGLLPFGYDSDSDMMIILAVVVALLAGLGGGLVLWMLAKKIFSDDSQTPARLERIKQLIEEAKAEQNAKYSEAMALRASLVKQAQALQGD